MEASGSVLSKSDVCAIIRFLCLEGVGGNEIYSHLCRVIGEYNIMSKYTVYQWIEKFKAGRGHMEDESCFG